MMRSTSTTAYLLSRQSVIGTVLPRQNTADVGVLTKGNEMNRTKDILIVIVCAVAVCATAIVGALILTRGLI